MLKSVKTFLSGNSQFDREKAFHDELEHYVQERIAGYRACGYKSAECSYSLDRLRQMFRNERNYPQDSDYNQRKVIE